MTILKQYKGTSVKELQAQACEILATDDIRDSKQEASIAIAMSLASYYTTKKPSLRSQSEVRARHVMENQFGGKLTVIYEAFVEKEINQLTQNTKGKTVSKVFKKLQRGVLCRGIHWSKVKGL